MIRRPSPAVLIASVALFFSLGGASLGATEREKALAYARPGDAHVHVYDCRRHGERAHCRVTFATKAAVTDNGQPVMAHYVGRVFIKRGLCSFNPNFFAWQPCRPTVRIRSRLARAGFHSW